MYQNGWNIFCVSWNIFFSMMIWIKKDTECLNGMIFLQPIFNFKYLVILNISVVLYFEYPVILNISAVLYFKYPVILNISAVLYFKYTVILNISAVLYFKYPVILNISAASEDKATSACDLKFMKNHELIIIYKILYLSIFIVCYSHTYVFFFLFHTEYRYDQGNVLRI